MQLKEFFDKYNRVALAFSGGTDSSYLLYAAARFGTDICAYYVSTAFQPEFEYRDALAAAEFAGVKMQVIKLDILSDIQVASNPEDRCYHCKLRIFAAIANAAAKDGYDVIIDGTNASDNADDRPGMRALEELNVLSPLRICGITKDDVRRFSREAGLFTWNKPAYACLATRIPTGRRIEKCDLQKVELGENALMEMGFSDFRIRLGDGFAKLQVKPEQMDMAVNRRREIMDALSSFGDVLLDLKCR